MLQKLMQILGAIVRTCWLQEMVGTTEFEVVCELRHAPRRWFCPAALSGDRRLSWSRCRQELHVHAPLNMSFSDSDPQAQETLTAGEECSHNRLQATGWKLGEWNLGVHTYTHDAYTHGKENEIPF